jgi:predicted MFS family arabinose efflux permease
MFNLLTGAALLAASVVAGRLWDTVGARWTFLGGALLAALALLGLFALPAPGATSTGSGSDRR